MRFVRRPRTWAAVAVAAALVVTAAGCSSKSNSSSSSSTPDKVTYITSFGTFGRDAYVYVAKEKGYFKAANIDVDIKPGTGTTNATDIASGKAQFGPMDFSAAILQLSKQPLGVQAIAAIQQNSMSTIMALPSSGITQPKDLEGKTIGVAPGGVEQKLFPVYAKLAGFDPTNVKFVDAANNVLPSMLTQSKVDAVSQFIVGEPTVKNISHAQQLTVLPYDKYIGDLYGNALFTSTALIKSNPGLVKRFRDALLKGLQDSLNDPAGAAKILQKYVPTANPTSAAAELTLMKDYVNGDGPIGQMTEQKTAQMIAILQGAGAISKSVDPNTLVDFDLVPNQS